MFDLGVRYDTDALFSLDRWFPGLRAVDFGSGSAILEFDRRLLAFDQRLLAFDRRLLAFDRRLLDLDQRLLAFDQRIQKPQKNIDISIATM
ncbi:hypothetical protein F3157_09435 [Virgibacillus dakarensis]|uniref:hypothetical protein n=1 Tax=Lentibacillus populi TaxID=1827502 RepID=UPI0012D8C154|nr:hypothetical protein [Lentibacillus populi]MTW85877.1 hypothetical protein [Virgibacillus dakarensis]